MGEYADKGRLAFVIVAFPRGVTFRRLSLRLFKQSWFRWFIILPGSGFSNKLCIYGALLRPRRILTWAMCLLL